MPDSRSRTIYVKIMNHIKTQFPFFANNPDVVYLDSGATSQKPQIVLNTIQTFYEKDNANAGRSAYPISSKLSRQVEEVRTQTASFIGAEHPEEIIFTSGATDAIFKAISMITLQTLQDGDEVLYSPYDHKSFTLPWFQMQAQLKKFGIHINLIPYAIRKTGGADIADIRSKITAKTKVICITHIHNIFGADSDIQELDDLRKKGITIMVDGTQSVGHIPVNVQKLGADIFVFSGHKMFAAQGVGIFYVKKSLQKELTPLSIGGGKGAEIQSDKVVVSDFYLALEAGTLNYAGILSLGAAITFIESIGLQNIHLHLSTLTQYALKELRKNPHIQFTKGPNYWTCAAGFGIISFTHDSLSSQEVGYILSEHGICVRAGDHCSTTSDDVSNSIRISMHIYNSTEDIDRLIKVLSLIE